MRTLVWATAAFIAISVGVQAAKSRKPKPPATVTVTEKQNNGKVALNRGDTLVVRLESNPTTGYTWKVSKCDSKILKLAGEPVFEQPVRKPPVVGAPGHQVFKFRTPAVGKTKLQLEYRRPWEKNAKPEETFTVNVEVKDRK